MIPNRHVKRARQVLRLAVAEPSWRQLSQEARVVHAVALLIAGRNGHFSEAALNAGLADRPTVALARAMLKDVGAA